MSLENRDQVLQESPPEPEQEFWQKSSKKKYTREFLLSLSELDICKKLPSGFDTSNLSEFQDASSSVLEWQRSLGGLSVQSLRRNDYGSLPPNRLDSSRGSTGRWDAHSSGSSDRDGDLQSEQDMQDSGRGFGNQPRRFWQHPEHDGLLGSGAFPRPSGYAGVSAPRPRGNGHYQLNRSTEPYQPPRPYKAVPYLRKDNTDSVNEETFGSADCACEDRVEEERKRRASFELMRKEQQKALQEKKKQNPDNHKEKVDADISALLEKSEDEKDKRKEEKSDVSLAPLLLQRFPPHIQPTAPRPLVPPGFASAIVEKNVVQSSITSVQIFFSTYTTPASRPLVTPGFASAILEKNLVVQSSITSVEAGHAVTEDSVPLDNDLDKKNDSTAGIEAFKDSVGLENVSNKASGLQEVDEIWEVDVANDLLNKKESTCNAVDAKSQSHSSSILEKLFGGALSKSNNSSPHLVEHQDSKADEETWSPVTKSSKFAHWFLEDEKRSTEDLSSRNLFSLIVSNERIGSQASLVSDDKAIEHVPSPIPCENDKAFKNLLAFPAAPPFSEPHNQSDNQDSRSIVLTCQDLEQVILAEANESSSSLQHAIAEPWAILDGSSGKQKADVDDLASQHLLSLLQKGTNSKESMSCSNTVDVVSFDKSVVSDIQASPNFGFVESAVIKNSETVQSSEKTLTLEALFGAAFMNELHAVGAPVSAQRGSVGEVDEGSVTQSHGMPFAHLDGGSVSSTPNEYQSNNIFCRGNREAFNHTQEAKSHKTSGLWLEDKESSLEGLKIAEKSYEERALEIHLPEEDSLIIVGDALDPIASNSSSFRGVNRTENFVPEKVPEERNEPLLKTILMEGGMGAPGLGGPSLVHVPYDLAESDNLYHHMHGRPPSKFPQELNRMRPLFRQIDQHTNRNPQMKFRGPEGIHHDPHHSFPPNIIPQLAFTNASGPHLEPPPHHPMLQQMPMPENFPLHHMLQGLPRGVPLSHPINHIRGCMPEMNNLHGFPLNNRQPNYGGPAIGMPGSVVGGGGGVNPEALQRLFEMELRANQKQIRPAAAGHIPGIFGPELDMSFRYR